MDEQKPQKNFWETKWGIFIAIFFLPIFLSFLIWKQNWNRNIKIGLIASIWGIGIIGAFIQSVEESAYQRGYDARKNEAVQQVAATHDSLTQVPTTQPTTPPEAPKSPKDDPSKYIAYSDDLTALFDRQVTAGKVLSETVEKFPNITDEELVALVAATLIIEKAHDNALSMNPPQELASTHQKYLQAFKLMNEAMPLLRDGLDNSDKSLINQATTKMNQANKIQNEATSEVDAFTASIK